MRFGLPSSQGSSLAVRRLLSLAAGGLAGAGISVLYHVYNLKEPLRTLKWHDVLGSAVGLASAAAAVRHPELVTQVVPAAYSRWLEKRPMLTKSVTTGVTYALGDLLAQWIERGQEARRLREAGEAVDLGPFDWRRAGVFMVFGTLLAGPVYTVWFDRIDRLPYLIYQMKQDSRREHIANIVRYAKARGVEIPPEVAKTPELHRVTYVGSKILADQFVFSSLYTVFFFYGVGLVSGKRLDECAEDVRHKFLPTYATDCAVWPLLQMVNFTLVPQHLRVLFVNVCNTAWNAFLSGMFNASHSHAPSKAPSHKRPVAPQRPPSPPPQLASEQ